MLEISHYFVKLNYVSPYDINLLLQLAKIFPVFGKPKETLKYAHETATMCCSEPGHNSKPCCPLPISEIFSPAKKLREIQTFFTPIVPE
jgi:hypothetical protein